MAMALDLKARELSVLARMATDELEALCLPSERTERLAQLLNGLEAAAADLSAELAPRVAAAVTAAPTPAPRNCQVFDLRSRQRIA